MSGKDPQDHEPPARTEQVAEVVESAASKLFDLRIMIGGLFVVYGVLLTIYSFFDSKAEIDKAAGIHINLWLGLGMLLVGIVFLLWAKVQPPKPVEPDTSLEAPPPT